ncbi:MAG: hypothetical protein D3904_07880 [Candidatus Electrothrix sp. EH2]|nr:hypothetical protein [Candidatus Electrothrix sp. EH2]
MKIQRIYTDTSVIGGCFDSEFTKWSNGLMQDFKLGTFKPLLSEIVRAEKIRLFNAVNLENGYRTVQIYSPREVTVYGAD